LPLKIYEVLLSDYTKEFKTNLHIAYPVMLGQLGHVMVGFVDNLMVGQLGAAALAAISLGNSLIFIALSLGIGFSFAIRLSTNPNHQGLQRPVNYVYH